MNFWIGGSGPIYHAVCARLDDGSVKCWGNNGIGILGTGSSASRATPASQGIDFGVGRTVSSFHVGLWSQCAILDDDSLRCWGDNRNGQLGYGDTTTRGAPGPAVNVGPGRVASEVSVGMFYTCALLDDGSVRCWGPNTYGQLGNGDTTARTAPRSTSIALG